MTNGVKVDLEKPTPLTFLNAVPEVPTKGTTEYGIAESGETYLEAILLIKERTRAVWYVLLILPMSWAFPSQACHVP